MAPHVRRAQGGLHRCAVGQHAHPRGGCVPDEQVRRREAAGGARPAAGAEVHAAARAGGPQGQDGHGDAASQ
eukprot:3581834-Prymnesium_polylepis.2